MTAKIKGDINNVFDVKKPVQVAEKKSGKGLTKMTFDLPTTAKKQLARMAVDMDKTQRELLAEALDDFFRKYGKPEIAR